MLQRSARYVVFALVSAGACCMSATASARGCNGVVDQLKWGCAAWDNNNGPQYPHYKAPQKAQPAPAKVAPAPSAALQPPRPNAGNGIVSRDGAGIVSRDGAGVISRDGAGLIGHDGGSLVGNSGGTMRK